MIVDAPLPPILSVPFAAAGDKFRILVAAGETVRRGQTVVQGGDGADVCAPCAGEVCTIGEVMLAGGDMAPAVILNTMGDERAPPIAGDSPPRWLKAAGIVGLGGGAYPAWRKWRGGLRVLAVNAVESGDGLSCDAALLRETGDALLAAIARVGRFLGVGENHLILSEKMPRPNVADKTDGGENLTVHIIAGEYALGAEQLLLRRILKSPAPSPPSDYGVICFNVATLLAIDEALVFGAPMTRRVTTVRTEGGDEINVRAPFGMSLGDLAKFLECSARHGRVGYRRLPPQAVLCHAANRVDFSPPSPPLLARPCIRCGECAPVCPVSLSPWRLHAWERDNHWDKLMQGRVMDCLECGRCDEVCPSNIPLAASFAAVKRRLAAQNLERAQARRWREKHENRARRRAEATGAEINVDELVAAAIAAGKTPPVN